MDRKKIALVVGAGAVKNAWQPVLKAIKNVTGKDLDSDGANCYFANLIYLLRVYSTIPHPKSKTLLEITKQNARLLKNGICEELKKAESSFDITVQKEFSEILKKIITPDIENFLLVSTNWDTVIDNKIDELIKVSNLKMGGPIRTFHIHGSIESFDTLFLPSEVTSEIYKTEKEKFYSGKIHSYFMEALMESQRIVLYGLSLDPLDAELLQSIASACISKDILEEIIIINPDHQLVANRLKAILIECKIKISGYRHDDLNNVTHY